MCVPVGADANSGLIMTKPVCPLHATTLVSREVRWSNKW